MSSPFGPFEESDWVPVQYEQFTVGKRETSKSGRLEILGLDGKPLIVLHGGGHSGYKKSDPSAVATASIGAQPAVLGKCDVALFPPGATNTNFFGQASIYLSSNGADIWAGGNEHGGDLVLFPPNIDIRNRRNPRYASFHLEGANRTLWMGGNGMAGQILIYPGTANVNNHAPNQASIRLDGAAGDIILQNADCAEEFDIAADAAEVEPGTVMVMDDDGKLRPSEEAFDRRVAGVVSGAGDYKPGIVLDRQYSTGPRLPIALVGKVFCKVDADHGAIQVGDLLTTSPTPGHAMKADDPLKAFGAVLGKALRPLQSGQGLIPVLVALQ